MSEQILSPQDLDRVSTTPLIAAGTYLNDSRGRRWAYIQAGEALVQGDAVEHLSLTAISVDNQLTAAAINTHAINDVNSPFTTTALVGADFLVTNGHVYWFWVDDGTGASQGGPILARQGDDDITVYFVNSDDGLLEVALDTTSDYTVFTLSRVSPTDAAAGTQQIGGYVQRVAGIADESWGWVLTNGPGISLQDISGTAITPGVPIVSGGAAGTVEGSDTTAAADSNFLAGVGLLDIGTADGLAPIIADCKEIFKMLPNAPSNKNIAYPGDGIGKL